MADEDQLHGPLGRASHRDGSVAAMAMRITTNRYLHAYLPMIGRTHQNCLSR
jgi:hypothetical protein